MGLNGPLANNSCVFKPIRVLGFVLLFAGVGCPKPAEPPADLEEKPYEYKTLRNLPACATDEVQKYPDHRCFTYRAVAGVSMGGGASSKLGFTYPELFDVVGVMGTPFSDTTFFWNMMLDEFMGGFCDLETLEGVMAAHPDNPDILMIPFRCLLWRPR